MGKYTVSAHAQSIKTKPDQQMLYMFEDICTLFNNTKFIIQTLTPNQKQYTMVNHRSGIHLSTEGRAKLEV